MTAAAGPAGRRPDVARLVAAYLLRHPEERPGLEPLIAQLELPDPPDRRTTLPGHLTAAALLLHPLRPALLLVRHRALLRWLQPGGHLERGEAPPAAALRELREETGVSGASLHGWHAAAALPCGGMPPLDIDVHAIPANARKAEPEHLHLDFRYVCVLAPDDPVVLRPQLAEVSHLRWAPLADLAERDSVPGLGRAARKLAAVLAGRAGAAADR